MGLLGMFKKKSDKPNSNLDPPPVPSGTAPKMPGPDSAAAPSPEAPPQMTDDLSAGVPPPPSLDASPDAASGPDTVPDSPDIPPLPAPEISEKPTDDILPLPTTPETSEKPADDIPPLPAPEISEKPADDIPPLPAPETSEKPADDIPPLPTAPDPSDLPDDIPPLPEEPTPDGLISDEVPDMPETPDIESVDPFSDNEALKDFDTSDLNAEIDSELSSIDDGEEEPEHYPIDAESEVAFEDEDDYNILYEKKPYVNYATFNKAVEIINSIGKESKTAHDAIMRIEEINKDMESYYNSWRINLDFFEKKIIRIDELIYKGD